MQISRANRGDPERILINAQNMSGVPSVVGCPAFWATGLDITTSPTATASFHGVAMTGAKVGLNGMRELAGLWTQVVANNGFGMVQVWGMNQNIVVVTGTTTAVAGAYLHANSGTAYTGYTSGLVYMFASNVATAQGLDALPHVIVMSAVTSGYPGTIGLIRCLH